MDSVIRFEREGEASEYFEDLTNDELMTCEDRAVEHQKLNQTTPYGVVLLSFWYSTYSGLA